MIVADTQPRLRSDAARNRQRLLAAAEQVFAEQGLDAGVEEVARAAGVGVGTLYRRFATKDMLIAALVTEALAGMLELAVTASTMPDGKGLESFLEAASAFQARHRGSLAKLWSYDPAAEVPSAMRAAIGRLLEDAKRHGRVRAELSETDISLVLWSIRGVIETTGVSAPNAWRRHLEILLAGVRPAEPRLAHRPLTRAQFRQVVGHS